MTRRATVIAYHAVGGCPRDKDRHNLFVSLGAFAQQMEFLARRRRVVDLDEAVGGDVGPGPPAVAITFDDAYRNVLELASPVLRHHGFPAAVFVPTAYLGGRNTWIDDTPCDVTVMDEEELVAGDNAGLRMESHGHGHIDYGDATRERASEDLITSLQALESVTGRRPTYFAYPFGSHSDAAQAAARDAGLRAAFTIDEPHGGDFAYERVQITPLDGSALFALKTSGRYMGLRHGRATRAVYGAVKPLVRRVLGRGR